MHEREIARGLELGLQGADSIVDRTIPTFSRGELPHFAGINTFLKAPYVEDVRRAGEFDVAVLGVPFRRRDDVPIRHPLRPAGQHRPVRRRRLLGRVHPARVQMVITLVASLSLLLVAGPGPGGVHPRREPSVRPGAADLG